MEQTVMQSVPQAAAIWLVMLAVAVIAVAGLWLPGRRAAADPDRPDGDPVGPDADSRAWEDRYADEVTVAADRAAATARRGRAEWERAQEALDQAWAAFEAADRAARRSAAAAPYGVPGECEADEGAPRSVPAALDPADRERFLHRAATAACRRRELSMHELNDILAHRDGWDPRLHPVRQETALLQAVRRQALVTYEEAVLREKQAWHTAEVAAAALRTLRDEACAAQLAVGRPTAGQLWWAGQWAPAEVADVALPVVAVGSVEAELVEAETMEAGLMELEPLEAGLMEAGPVPAIVLATLRFPTVPLPTVQLTRSGAPATVPAQAGAPALESLRQPLAVAGADGARR